MILLASNWWSLAIRGVVAILLGVLTFIWPGITLVALVMLFGAYALIDGLLNIAGAWRASMRHERWGVLVLEGFTGIVAAIVTVFWPAITAVALGIVIAAWALLTGILEILAAIKLRKHFAGELLLALSGAASVLFGIFLLVFPLAGALAIALWVGVYSLIFGVLLVALGFRLRSWGKRPPAEFPVHAPVR